MMETKKIYDKKGNPTCVSDNKNKPQDCQYYGTNFDMTEWCILLNNPLNRRSSYSCSSLEPCVKCPVWN